MWTRFIYFVYRYYKNVVYMLSRTYFCWLYNIKTALNFVSNLEFLLEILSTLTYKLAIRFSEYG